MGLLTGAYLASWIPAVKLEITGSFTAAMDDIERELARDLRDAMDQAGSGLVDDLRQQTLKAIPRGPRVANAWRRQTFPRSPLKLTLHPTAFVWSRAPNIISAFDEGRTITAKRGRYLCWPTGYNAIGGRRNAGSRGGLRVTPEEMAAAKGQAFIIPSKSNRNVKLWCLRVRTESTPSASRRGRGRTRFYVTKRDIEVNTGRGRRGERAARTQQLLKAGFVPMFILMKSVTPKKMLDVDAAGERAADRLVGLIAAAKGGS